jgi:putative transposase
MNLTPDIDHSLLRGVLKVLAEKGLDGLGPVFQTVLNEAMKIERTEYLQAEPYERTASRRGQANGFKDKTITTRVGPLDLNIPQVRDSKFYPESLERGCRSEMALKLSLAEMYVTGVSTRKVAKITEKLCGTEVSSTHISNMAKLLDEELAKFRDRPLGEFPFVFFDAQYQRVRHDGVVRSLAVLIAVGINLNGQRELLGVSVSLSEAEVHWRSFFSILGQRGLSGVKLIISDDHVGLGAARNAVFPSIPWQRCQFHLSQNAQAYVPAIGMRPEIAQAMRDIFNCSSLSDARAMVKNVVEKYGKSAPKFVDWLEKNIEEGFSIYNFPRPFWKKLRTSNVMERTNREIKRRTKVAVLFPNEASCLRLITAVLREIHEDWVTGKTYLNLNQV